MKSINVPVVVLKALQAGAALAISISGGKDSHAMLALLTKWFRENNFAGKLFAIHADLGRAEWHHTPRFIEKLADRYGVELVVVQRTGGDLVSRIEDRFKKLEGTDRPAWPSSAQRYCTSDLKRTPIDKYLRKFDNVVCAMGLRADESTARSKKLPCAPRKQIVTKSRKAIDWNPIIEFNEDDVWKACGTSTEEVNQLRHQYQQTDDPETHEKLFDQVGIHPAYVIGNERLSCALCVLGSKGDLQRGAKHNPALYQRYVQLEHESGFTFKKGFSLTELVIQ